MSNRERKQTGGRSNIEKRQSSAREAFPSKQATPRPYSARNKSENVSMSRPFSARPERSNSDFVDKCIPARPYSAHSSSPVIKSSQFVLPRDKQPFYEPFYEDTNDSIALVRPFTPEDYTLEHQYKVPIVLKKTAYTTVPKHEETKKLFKRPLSCPETWIKKNSEPSWQENSNFNEKLEEKNRINYVRKFIERNRDRMHCYDRCFIGKTPHQICDIISSSPTYLNDMIVFHRLENRLILGTSSERVFKLMDQRHMNTPSNNVSMKNPFSASLTTSRNERDDRMTRLLMPAMLTHEDSFRRGFNHTLEYGNFSRLNGILKANKESILNR